MKNDKSTKYMKNCDKKRSKRKVLIAVLISIVAIPLVVFSICIGVFALWANSIQLDTTLLPTKSAIPTYYDCDGVKIIVDDDKYIEYEDLPINLVNAFVALEDKRFFSHKGYDIIRIGGALISNAKSGSLKEGASTITQQLVKNTHLTHEKTISRKLKEIAIAIKLEKEYSKQEIMSMYLSVIYFGGGAYGVSSASRLYFDKEVEDLTLDECAMLAGIVKNPSKYNPNNESDLPKQRRDLVLKVMHDQGYITDDEYLDAKNKDVKHTINTSKSNIYSSYISRVRDEVCKELNITKYQLDNSGYDIYTNLDRNIQQSLVTISKDKRNRENSDIQNVSIVVDNKNEIVSAYHSSLPYNISVQAGSIIKPLAVYVPAINENLVSLSTPITDEKVDYNGYSPNNFNDKYIGNTTIEEGIKQSINSIAVKTLDYVGLNTAVNYLNRFNIEVDENARNYSLALGSISVDPIKIANAYCTIANDGRYSNARFCKLVMSKGIKIYEPKKSNDKIVKTSTTSLIKYALINTVKDGTARTLSSLDFDIASKTGTAENNQGKNLSAWNVSFNDDYTVLVWHGKDDGMNEKGGGYPTFHAMKIWQELSKIMPLAKHIDCSKDTVRLDIDTYATSTNKCVMLASENTALEYRKSQIFANDNIPNQISNCFEIIDGDINVDIRKNKDKVSISFDTNDIYSYNIYRHDALGKMLIMSLNGKDCQDRFSLIDMPISLDVVEYEIECYITCNKDVKKVSKYTIIM